MPSLQPTLMQSKTGSWPKAPFPEDLKTHPLLVVDYAKVVDRDKDEIQTLYDACTTLGFFYLKNFGSLHDLTEPMFEMGEATFEMPLDELLKFEQGDGGMSAGYKRAGSTNVDAKGNVDTVQFINVSKHDALYYPEVKMRTYPSAVNERMDTVRAFIQQSDDVLQNLMEALETKIGLEKGTFRALHPPDRLSGSESRCIMKPSAGESRYLPEGKGEDGSPAAAIGAHTDFGSFSMLHGRGIGGLQVLPPGSKEWQWIKPLPGHAVCNVGDTLSVYTGGLFRSNIHRVVPPPPPQDRFTRWSLVYFIRPAFDEILAPLSAKSDIIKQATEKNESMRNMDKHVTAGEWFQRRIINQRNANRKGPETWAASRGTEHTPQAA